MIGNTLTVSTWLLLCVATAGHCVEPMPSPVLQVADLGSTSRAHEFGGVLLASQPGQADLAIARDRGIRTIISLRLETEPTGFDERAEAARLGMQYTSLPWHAPADLTDAVFDAARKLLSETQRPFLLHCGSGNRVGAVWIPWRVLDGGVSYETALVEGKTIGLVTPEYEQKAKDYVERRRAGS